MGNFYTNVTVKGPSRDEIVQFLSESGRCAYLATPGDGFCVIYDEASDEQQSGESLSDLAASLAARFNAPALAVMNHDDDMLWYRLYQGEQLVDEYDSAPGCFDENSAGSPPAGGDAAALCAAFGLDGTAAQPVEAILRKPSRAINDDGYALEVERHADLVGALGLPPCAVAAGFKYIDQGELPQGLDQDTLARVDG